MSVRRAALGACVAIGALLAQARGDESTPAPRAGALDTLDMGVTPGKPMELARDGEPAERIIARREAGRAWIIVARNVGKQYEREAAPLDDAEWRALLDTVARLGLATWRPRPSGQDAVDYATTRLELGAGGKPVNEQRWSRPLENEAPPLALAHALALLARKKLERPQLHYFGP